jgi:hypothetical protein
MYKEQAAYRCSSFFEKAFVKQILPLNMRSEMRSGSVSPNRTLNRIL